MPEATFVLLASECDKARVAHPDTQHESGAHDLGSFMSRNACEGANICKPRDRHYDKFHDPDRPGVFRRLPLA